MRFHDAVERLVPSFGTAARSTVVGLGLGLVTGPLAPVVGLTVGVGATVDAAVRGRVGYERSWLAAADHFTRRK